MRYEHVWNDWNAAGINLNVLFSLNFFFRVGSYVFMCVHAYVCTVCSMFRHVVQMILTMKMDFVFVSRKDQKNHFICNEIVAKILNIFCDLDHEYLRYFYPSLICTQVYVYFAFLWCALFLFAAYFSNL